MSVVGDGAGAPARSRYVRLWIWVTVVGFASALLAVPAAAAPGYLDPGFGTDGKVVTDLESAGATAVAIQTNGKIVVGGASGAPDRDFTVARYLPDGSLDPIFGGDGVVTTDFGLFDAVRAVAIQADGKILAAGGADQDFAIARYRRDGGLDTTFSGDGKLVTNWTPTIDVAGDVALDADQKIVVVGLAGGATGQFAVARYASS